VHWKLIICLHANRTEDDTAQSKRVAWLLCTYTHKNTTFTQYYLQT